MSKAIGLIETKGLVAAIEALDAALKAANVTLQSKELTDGGWVMITVTGDVGSVTAAIEAGGAAAKRVGQLITAHVIPRLSDEVFAIVTPAMPDQTVNAVNLPIVEPLTEPVAEPVAEPVTEPVTEPLAEPEKDAAEVKNSTVNFKNKNYQVFAKGGIDRLKVVQLRQLVRQLNLDTIDRSLIKFANKEQLIKAIRDHMKGGHL
ncbi:BMC domain-containing protein [Fusibacter sp. 3D3]|uniref:BMC domain-containing protein n=1 Tax=Fusibacter sp. 3D3 TaxID=1048380 RepID=UPI0008532695|nr:BMC domain-containing protein [Fusibacter sp. 3D3]GAU75891.1 ethanolamine utilization protein similar to PduA/PduJ [Fusibacter sp. 3D3]